MANAPDKGTKKKGGGGLTLLVAMTLAMVVVITPATILMFFFGLLPTWAALLTDRSKDKFSTFCIGSMNFAGMFPYLMQLWTGDNSLAQARDILTNVFSLGVIIGAAAFGWLMFSFIPPVVGSFLTVMSQRRIATLRNDQRKLIEEWGDAVTRTKEEEEAFRNQPPGAAPAPGAPRS